MVKFAKELQPEKAKFPICVTESGIINFANCLQLLKALSAIRVSWLGNSTTSNSSGSMSLPKLAISSLLEHLTLFGLKTTLTTSPAVTPTSATVSSLPIKRSPRTISTPVVLRVSSSQVSCLSLICCFSSLPVVSGATSRQIGSPFTCSAEILIAIGQ